MRHIINVLRYSKQLRNYYITIATLSIIISLITLAQPFITKEVIGQFSSEGSPSANILITLVILYFISDFSITLLTNLAGYFGDMMTIKLRRHLSEKYYEKLLRLPQRYFDNQRTGALVNKLSRSIENLTQTLQMFSNSFLQLILTTILTFAVTAFYSPFAALLMISLYPILLWLTRKTSVFWQEIEHKKNAHLDEAFGRFTEVISQMRVVKSFRQGNRELSIFQKKFGNVVPLTSTQSVFWHKQDIFRRFVVNAIFAGIFVVIVRQTYKGDLALEDLVLLIQYSLLMRIPLFSLSFIVDSTQRAITGSKDFFDVMELDSEPGADEEETDVEHIDTTEAEVRFENVSFAYEDLEVIKDLSFSIEAGKKLALVSESGGGKTTIANLLIGLYQASNGKIHIGGNAISDMPFYWLREQVGVVFQDAELFSGTIFENISYANPEATEAEVISAAKAANAHSFISKYENAYQTEIGERGIKLSGGQKQRIAIARALLKNAPILILDEATSALDSKTEVEVQSALEHLMKGRTSLIIAHRLSTIANVDTIMTLKDGAIEEIGSPEELAQSNGTYAKLLKLQQASPEERKKQLENFDIRTL